MARVRMSHETETRSMHARSTSGWQALLVISRPCRRRRWDGERFRRKASRSIPLCGPEGAIRIGAGFAADSRAETALPAIMMPIDEEPFHGTLGPPLSGVSARYSAARSAGGRRRTAGQPGDTMPGSIAIRPIANRIAGAFWGKTFLSATTGRRPGCLPGIA